MKNNFTYTKVFFSIYMLYFISIVLFVSTGLALQIPFLGLLGQIFKITVAFLLIFLIGIQGLNVRQWLFFFVLFSLCLLNSFFSKSSIFIFFLLFLFASKSIEVEKFITYDFVLRIFTVVLVVLLNKIGVLQDNILVRDSGVIRHSLGFVSPNTIGVLVFCIVVDYLIIKWKNVNLLDFFTLGIVTYVLFRITGSRTASLLIIVTLFVFFVSRYTNFFKGNIINGFIFISPLIFTIASFFMVMKISVGSRVFFVINKYTSNRLYFYDQVYNNYGFSLFGQDIPLLSLSYAKKNGLTPLYLDSSYLSLGIHYGMVMSFLLLLVLLIIILKQIKFKNTSMLLLTFLICVYGFSEIIIFKPEVSLVCVMGSFLLNSLGNGQENFEKL